MTVRDRTTNHTSEDGPQRLPLALYMYVVIVNEGATHGTLFDLTGSLSRIGNNRSALTASPDAEAVSFEWRMFVEAKDISDTHSHFSTKKEFAGWASPLAVPGKQSINKQVRFRSTPARLTPGRYELEITGSTYPKRRWLFGNSVIGQTRNFTLGGAEIESLNATTLSNEGVQAITDIRFDRL